jgi:hypothetical protein
VNARASWRDAVDRRLKRCDRIGERSLDLGAKPERDNHHVACARGEPAAPEEFAHASLRSVFREVEPSLGRVERFAVVVGCFERVHARRAVDDENVPAAGTSEALGFGLRKRKRNREHREDLEKEEPTEADALKRRVRAQVGKRARPEERA